MEGVGLRPLLAFERRQREVEPELLETLLEQSFGDRVGEREQRVVRRTTRGFERTNRTKDLLARASWSRAENIEGDSDRVRELGDRLRLIRCVWFAAAFRADDERSHELAAGDHRKGELSPECGIDSVEVHDLVRCPHRDERSIVLVDHSEVAGSIIEQKFDRRRIGVLPERFDGAAHDDVCFGDERDLARETFDRKLVFVALAEEYGIDKAVDAGVDLTQ